jgi:adenosylmethionine-8-amino-7-oxononanoate aminotransferase
MAIISPEEHNESQTYLLHPSISHPSPKVVAAQGNYLILENGQRILDASGGPAVTSLGHGNRDVQRAVVNQMQQLSYCHSLFWSNPAAEELAKEVIESTKGVMAKALFYNSGI